VYIWSRIPGIHINIEVSQYVSFVNFRVNYREAGTEFQGSTWHSCLTATCHRFNLCDLPVTFITWPQHLNEFWAYKCPTLCFCFLKSMSFTLLCPLYFSSYELTLYKSLFCLIVLKTSRNVEEIFGHAVYISLFFVTFMQNSFLWQYIFMNYAHDVHKNVSQSSCLKWPLLFYSFKENWSISTNFTKTFLIWDFMKYNFVV